MTTFNRLLEFTDLARFTTRLAGNPTGGMNQKLCLARALRRPEVMNGVLQGHHVRLVFRAGAARPDLRELDAGDQAEMVSVTPRFEDAFMEALGGGPGGDSVLAQRMKSVTGDQGTVVEAIGLTKRFGRFTATDHVDCSVQRGGDFRPARPERRAQVHHLPDDVRLAQTHRRRRAGIGH